MRHVLKNAEEVAHKFVYDGINWYAGPNSSSRTCFASGDYVINWRLDTYHQRIRKEYANNILRDMWFDWRLDRDCVVIVNREEKIMLINSTYDGNCLGSDFRWALPEDWIVLQVSNTKINDPDILKKKCRRKLYELIAKEIIGTAMSDMHQGLLMAYTDYRPQKYFDNPWDKKTKYNIEGRSRYSIGSEKRFADFIDAMPKDIRNKRLVHDYVMHTDNTVNGEYKGEIIIQDVPTLQDIISGNFFIGDAYNTFLKKACFAHFQMSALGIKWKDFLYYWGTALEKYNDILMGKLHDYKLNWKCTKNAYLKALDFRLDWKEQFRTEPVWQDILKVYYNVFEEELEKFNKYNKDITAKNRQDALNICNGDPENQRIQQWRENSHVERSIQYIKYATWVPADFRNSGYWKEVYAGNQSRFTNTQLKLADENTIVTSRYCEVPVEDAVKMYKLFKINTERDKDKTRFDFSDNNIKCGIYTLNWFKYDTKVSDNSNRSLGKKEWCVCIGCHHIWMDDFYDFVHYYNLEDKFGSELPTN